MSSSLILLLVVVAAYLAAHGASEWLARRYLVVSGAEYLLLGILVGPQVGGFIDASTVDGFAPFMTLAFGWVGALVGAQFFIPSLLRIPASNYRIAFAEAAISFVVVTAAMALLLGWVFDLSPRALLMPAAALGAIATASAPSGIAVAGRESSVQAALMRQLQVNVAVDALFAIVAFGILLALTHPEPVGTVRPPTATEWMALTLAIGFGGGALFHLFVGMEREVDRLFIALAGALILASGAAAYLSLSPLLPAMLVGIVLVNTSATRESIRKVLTQVERPLYFVLLIFAGAAWEPSAQAWLLPVVAFLMIRFLAKVGAARLAARANAQIEPLGHNWGRGLLGHGGLSVAIGLSYLIVENAILPNIVYTATILSVLLTDLFSARLVRTLATEYGARMRRGIWLRDEPAEEKQT